MGHHPTKNPFRRARLGLDVNTQAGVDAYKARSVWGAWWQLDEKVRRRFFSSDDRDYVTRCGARLDAIASFRADPETDAERQFLKVCASDEEPRSARVRLWLLVQVVCRFQRAVTRAARADIAEHDAAALRAENLSLRAKCDHLERYVVELVSELRVATGEANPGICNVQWVTPLFQGPAQCGPPPVRFVMDKTRRGDPVGYLTANGLRSTASLSGPLTCGRPAC